MQHLSPAPSRVAPPLVHEAFFSAGDAGYLDGTVPFVQIRALSDGRTGRLHVLL